MLAVRLTLGQIKNFILTIAGQLPPQLVKGGGGREGSRDPGGGNTGKDRSVCRSVSTPAVYV